MYQYTEEQTVSMNKVEARVASTFFMDTNCSSVY